MNSEKRGLGIVFHSGSYDRLYHGISIALAALALGREVRLFFTYWALEYIKKGGSSFFVLDKEGETHREVLERNINKGHMQKIPELLAEAKKMGAKFYACTNSMGLLNIVRDELVDEVDKSMGITTFLTETTGDQILFI
ncbi:MAG: DsrE/DsrF/DrsH-like family protein [Candidatus Omnitrophota bacterium]